MPSKFNTYFGIKELHRLNTSITVGFDTETLQLQPEKGKLRLIQLGCLVSETIIVIDSFDLDDNDCCIQTAFLITGNAFGQHITQSLILAGYKNKETIPVEDLVAR